MGDGLRDKRGLADGGQRDEAYAIIEPVQDLPGHLQAEPGFPDPARTGQRKQAHVRVKQSVSYFFYLPLAADKRCGLRVEVGGLNAPNIGAGGGCACGCFEKQAVRSRKPEGFAQALRGVPVGPSALTAFEEANRIRVQAGPVGQVLLGQVRRVSVSAQQIPESQMLTGVHCRLSLARRPVGTWHHSTLPEYPEDLPC